MIAPLIFTSTKDNRKLRVKKENDQYKVFFDKETEGQETLWGLNCTDQENNKYSLEYLM